MKTTFNDYEVEIEEIPLSQCDEIWPYIMSWQTQIMLGNFKFFEDTRPEQIRFFQKFTCEHVYRMKEKTDEKTGSIKEVKVNLSYLDLDEYKIGWLLLFTEVLEYNFGLFSRARNLLVPLTRSEKKATEGS